MRLNIILIFLLSLALHSYTSAQKIDIGRVLSENQLATFHDQKLLLIDFWASWCAPCIVVNRQLEVVQQKNQDKLFILSMSHETIPVIEKHLTRHGNQLMVVADYENRAIEKYAVNSWPYAVLLNTYGKKIWEGHPADLSQPMIDNFYKKEKKPAQPWYEIFDIRDARSEVSGNTNDIEITYGTELEFFYEESAGRINFEGSVRELCRHIFGLNPLQVEVKPSKNIAIAINAAADYWYKNTGAIWEQVLSENSLKIDLTDKEMTTQELFYSQTDFFWSTGHFDWYDGSSSQNYIIQKDHLQASNHSISELAVLLSKITGKYYTVNKTSTNRFDWEVDISSAEALRRSLEKTYKIILSEKTENIQIFKIY